MLRGTNLPAVSAYNRSLVLDLIRRSDGLSRVELAEATGLSAQTLSNVTRRLMADEFIREAGKAGTGPGKPRTLLALNPSARFAVGIHIDPSLLTTVVLDLAGGIVAHRRTDVDPSIAPKEAIAELASGVESIIRDSGVKQSMISGIGVAAPGPLDTTHGRMFSPPLLERWNDVAIGAELTRKTGLTVVAEKDVTAAVLAETWLGTAEPLRNSMFLYYGTGIGVGFTVAGNVLRGESGNSGEIGHLLIDADGPACRCGRKGCLGDSVAPQTVLADASRAGVPGVDVAGSDLAEGWESFAKALRDGNSAAGKIADTLAMRLARAVVILRSTLDLGTAILGGPYWDVVSDLLLERVATFVRMDSEMPVQHGLSISTSRLGPDVVAVGAGCLVLDRAYSARPDDLLITS